MLSNGIKINECYNCVYIKTTTSRYVIVYLYVDNMLIMGGKHNIISATKKMLTKHFGMKDMSIADVTLGIKILKNLKDLFYLNLITLRLYLRSSMCMMKAQLKPTILKSTFGQI